MSVPVSLVFVFGLGPLVAGLYLAGRARVIAAHGHDDQADFTRHIESYRSTVLLTVGAAFTAGGVGTLLLGGLELAGQVCTYGFIALGFAFTLVVLGTRTTIG